MVRALVLAFLLLGGCVAATADAVYALDTAYREGEGILDFNAAQDEVLAAAKAEFGLLTSRAMREEKTQKGYPMLTDRDMVTVIIQPHPGFEAYTRVRARISAFSNPERRQKIDQYLDAITARLKG